MATSGEGPARKMCALSNLQWWEAVITRLWAATVHGWRLRACVTGWLLGVIASPACALKNMPYLPSTEATLGRVEAYIT